MIGAHGYATPGTWSSAWHVEPVALGALVVAAAAFALGRARLRADSDARVATGGRALAFYAGLVVVAAALMSPLHAVADTLLSAHMLQHIALMLVAAPLLVVARPWTALARALPDRIRIPATRSSIVGIGRRATQSGIAVWSLGTAVVWTWHLPAPYESALGNEVLHGFEHASFVAVSILFWEAVLRPDLSGPGYGAAIALSFATGLQSGALGALLAFATEPLYPTHAARATVWGLAPLADQQLAGVIMWVPMGGVYAAVMAALFLRWLRAVERRSPARSGAIDAGKRT